MHTHIPQAAKAASAPAGSLFDPVDGLSGEASLPRNLSDADCLLRGPRDTGRWPLTPLGPPIYLRDPICPRAPKGARAGVR